MTHCASGGARFLTAIAAGLPLPLNDDGIGYVSQGVVLVVGPAEKIVDAAQKLARHTRVVACSADRLPAGSARTNPLFIPCRIVAVHGHLGEFRVDAEDVAGNRLDLSPFSPRSDGVFDLLLDLSPDPMVTAHVKPPGYFAPPTDELDRAIDAIVALKGSFRKPRFVTYDASLCAHGAQGVRGCARCLNVCPAQAIVSAGDRIAVNMHLCQGCSTCMLVCPTGALSPAEESPEALLKAVFAKLLPGRSRLRLHQAGAAPIDDAATASLAVPAIAAAGPEIWFSALALGFQQVLLDLPAALPPSTQAAISAQIAQAHELLAALGLPTARIASSTGAAPASSLDEHSPHSAHLPPYADKRAQLLWALDVLHGLSFQAGFVELSAGADMGTVKIDSSRCTLCMTCVRLCPTRALISEANNLRLDFIENRCVQCNLCAAACPERAITLKPRFSLDEADRLIPVTISQGAQHYCPECGTPFISRALLDKGIEIMRQIATLDDAGITSLHCCPACRARRMNRPNGAF